MTIEERFERIEHVTAGLAEERLKDREENRRLWRDTQRQLDQLTRKVADMGDELRAADHRLGERIEQLGNELRDSDRRLGARIGSLVSAMGDFLLQQKKGDRQ